MKSVSMSSRPYGPRKGQLQDSWEIACEMMILLTYLISKLWMAGCPQLSWLLSQSSVFSQPWCMSLGCYSTHRTVTTLDVSLSPSRWIVSLHVSRNQHNTRHMGRVYKISESSESTVDIPVTDSSERHLMPKHRTPQFWGSESIWCSIPAWPSHATSRCVSPNALYLLLLISPSWVPWLWSVLFRQWDWAFLSASFVFWQVSRFW